MIAPHLWLTCSDNQRKLTIDALEIRSRIRERQTGKVIIREVIEKTITTSVADLKKYGGEVETWLKTYPEPNNPYGLKLARDVLMFRDKDLEQEALNALISQKVKDRPYINREIVRHSITRGYHEFHLTVVEPGEVSRLDSRQKTMIKNANLEYIQQSTNPKYIGVGCVVDNDNEVIFMVVSWPWAQEFRNSLGLPPKDLHVTIGFTKEDKHGISKGVDTLEW